MTKTAIQMMIDLIYQEPIDNINGHYLIIKAKELLEIEKKQIIDARENGFYSSENWKGDSEKYYNSKFKHD